MAAELKISGKMSVKKLKENFKNEFGGTLRVYDGRSKADDDARLAAIRRKDDAKGGELVCNGHLTVGSFERRMRDIFGIKVQVATPDDWTLALDGVTLAKLKDIPEKCSKADMESLVAYKRKDKIGDVATEVEDTEGIVNADDTPKTKQVRLAIYAAQQPRLISLQTLCEDDMEVVDEYGASFETYEHLVDHGSGEWVNLAFVPSGCCVELNVTDPNADDDDDDAYRLYSDDEFEIYPNYGMMNMQEAKENYEDDSASIERYTAYLNVEMGEDYDRLTNKGLKVAWERLKTNEVNAESYVPAVMQYVMSEEGGDKAFLQGLQVEDITMVFNIDIPEGEEFDPSKLDFINMDAEYEDNSEVLSELLAADMLLLNAIIYDGKMYFADGYDDVTEDPWGEAEYYYDIVDADQTILKVESEVEDNAENSSGKERLTLKQYILNLVYIFEEFDMDDCDGSYFTKFGKLSEFDLFDEEQIDDVLSDNYIYDEELSKDSFYDEVSEDDLYCVISNLVDNLDQGSIKLMQIKDGSKVIFEVSNDEPFVD